jgi:hypothetical protein
VWKRIYQDRSAGILPDWLAWLIVAGGAILVLSLFF